MIYKTMLADVMKSWNNSTLRTNYGPVPQGQEKVLGSHLAVADPLTIPGAVGAVSLPYLHWDDILLCGNTCTHILAHRVVPKEKTSADSHQHA